MSQSAKMARNFWRCIAILTSLITCGSCGISDSRQPDSVDAPVSAIPATDVKTYRAYVKPFQYSILTTGKIASSQEVSVNFRRNGIVSRIHVANNSFVRKGEVLASLENSKEVLLLSKAKLLVEEKKISFQDQMLSYSTLKDSGEFALIRRNIWIASGLASAEVALEEAKIDLENTIIKSPVEGVISNLNLTVGASVSEQLPLCMVHDPDKLLVNAKVLEGDALLLHNGVAATVTPSATIASAYDAIVVTINPRVDAKTGLVDIVLKLTSKQRAFPGTNVTVKLLIPYDKQIIVPKEALIIRDGRYVMFTVNGKKAKWKYVNIGRENGKEIEVLQGLEAGDTVIISNNLQLTHDAVIHAVSN